MADIYSFSLMMMRKNILAFFIPGSVAYQVDISVIRYVPDQAVANVNEMIDEANVFGVLAAIGTATAEVPFSIINRTTISLFYQKKIESP